MTWCKCKKPQPEPVSTECRRCGGRIRALELENEEIPSGGRRRVWPIDRVKS